MKEIKLPTFLFLGLFIVLAIIAVVVFSYILIAAVIIGAFLYAIAWVRAKYFRTNKKGPVIYEHGEY